MTHIVVDPVGLGLTGLVAAGVVAHGVGEVVRLRSAGASSHEEGRETE